MPTLIVNGQVISYPDDGEAPDNSSGQIAFAEAVAAALSSLVGPFDVPPQTMDISAYNTISNTAPITNLSFSTTSVKAITIYIATTRKSDITANSETQYNTLNAIYNADASPPWNMSTEGVGDAGITFTISSTGVVSFVINTAITVTSTYIAQLSYSAKALLTS